MDGIPIVGHISIPVDEIAGDEDGGKKGEDEDESNSNSDKEEDSKDQDDSKPSELKKIEIDSLKTDFNVGMPDISLIKM